MSEEKLSLEELRTRFVRVYAGVPDKLREEIIALVDGKPFNWNSAYIEVVGKTRSGGEILKHLLLIGLLEGNGD